MWFPNEWEEQAIDRLLQELGIQLPEVEAADDDSPEYLFDVDRDFNLQSNKFNER